MVASAGINAAGSLAPAHLICYDDGNAGKINLMSPLVTDES
jgi:hypothetical protein